MLVSNDIGALIRQVCHEHVLTQRALANIIGVSVRTIQRNQANNGGVQHTWEFHRLIKHIHPRTPELAGQLAASIGTSLEALGLVPPKAPPPPPPLPPPPAAATREHADAVVAAAADALNLVPRDARPIVAAIFARVGDLDVDLKGLVKLLVGGDAARQKPAAKK